MSIIECREINLNYDKKIVLKNISFQIDSGDYICIVGENGSGKTSLIQILLGLLKPSSGSVVFCNGLKHSDIGYLPQITPIHKYFPASVKEIVMSGTLNRKRRCPFYSKEDKILSKKVMQQLGLYEICKKNYRDLSGGQQQRVFLARALCAAKKVLVLDEPVTGLDPIAASELYDDIKSLNHQDNMTVIMVSHDIHSSLSHATKILHMNGELGFFGSVEDYKRSTVGSIFLGGTSHV